MAAGVRPARVRRCATCRFRSEDNDGHRSALVRQAEETARRSSGCREAPRAGGANGSPLAAIKLKQRDAICKRDDVVHLGREAARPPGAANGPLRASGSSLIN